MPHYTPHAACGPSRPPPVVYLEGLTPTWGWSNAPVYPARRYLLPKDAGCVSQLIKIIFTMSDQQPNILLTMCDTQPTAFLGCYAGEDRGTPNLDALAAQGTLFQRCYTACPLCTPARAGLFTGQTPSRSGAYTNSQPLGDTIRTMGQVFTEAGYRSAYIGKWHLDGHDYFGDGRCPAGWEDLYWYDGKRYLMDLTPEQVDAWRAGLYSTEAAEAADVGGAFPTWAARIGDRAERFLDEQTSEKPWLLVCSYDEPHHPFTCPPEFMQAFEGKSIPVGPSAYDDLSGKPAHQLEWRDGGHFGCSEPRPDYGNWVMLACNSYVDSEIGRVIKKAQAIADETGRPTWIIHTADHGDHCGSHRLNNKGPTAYDWNVKVPLIVVRPGAEHIAVSQESVVSLLDILPTICDASGVTLPPACDGVSFAELCGSTTHDIKRQALIEYTRYETAHDGFGGFEPMRCLVRWPWKLVLNLFRTDELYHLVEDPDELHNKINDADCATERDAMHDELLTWMNEHVDPWRGQPWERRPWHMVVEDRWTAPCRPVRGNGRTPPYYDYDTGLPTRGVAVQYTSRG